MSLTKEQLALRAEAYGASQIATIVGEGPGSLIDLYSEKIGNPRPDDAFDDNLPAELGTLEEEPICKVYARRTATFLARVDTLRHPKHPLILATPDRARFITAAAAEAALGGTDPGLTISSASALAEADRLVEAKRHAARFRHDYGKAGSGEVPAHEAIQTTIQMAVTGQRIVDLPVLFASEWGCRLDVFTVTWNETLFEALAEAVERFHVDHVLARVPPPPDASERYDEAMARLHPYDASKPLSTADEEDERLMLEFARFRAVEKRAEVLKKATAQQLKQRIGEASGFTSSALGKLSWKRTRDSTEVDWHKAALDFEMLAGECLNAFDAITADGGISPENRARLVERLKAIVPEATKTTNGHRRLLLTPKKGGDADLGAATLRLTLEPLKLGPGT